ncbi:MAG: hypothetical protein ABH885_00260 [Candidatus Omnitrophota bacterium]
MKNTFSEELESQNDIFHPEIVETFFGKPRPSASKRDNKPQQKVEPLSQKIVLAQKNNTMAIVSAGLAVLAIVMGAGLVYYAGALRHATQQSQKTLPASYSPGAKNDLKAPPAAKTEPTGGFTVVTGGIIDRRHVRDVTFEGDAGNYSIQLRQGLKLSNSGNLGWARVSFDMKGPIDLSGSEINFLLKAVGRPGSLLVILTDSNGKSCSRPMTVYPRWESKTLRLSAYAGCDTYKIARISLEFGSASIGNADNSSFILKEITIRQSNGANFFTR